MQTPQVRSNGVPSRIVSVRNQMQSCRTWCVVAADSARTGSAAPERTVHQTKENRKTLENTADLAGNGPSNKSTVGLCLETWAACIRGAECEHPCVSFQGGNRGWFTPQEYVRARIAKQSAKILVPPTKKEVVAVIQYTAMDCEQERILEQIFKIYVPHITQVIAEDLSGCASGALKEEIADVHQAIQELSNWCKTDHRAIHCVSDFGRVFQVERLTPCEQVQQSTVEQIDDFPCFFSGLRTRPRYSLASESGRRHQNSDLQPVSPRSRKEARRKKKLVVVATTARC